MWSNWMTGGASGTSIRSAGFTICCCDSTLYIFLLYTDQTELSASATTTHTRSVTESRWTRLIVLRAAARRSGDGLAGNYRVPFVQLAFNNLCCRAVAKPNFDSPAFGLIILAQHPYNPCLSCKYRC